MTSGSGGLLPAPVAHACERAVLPPGTLDSSYHVPSPESTPSPLFELPVLCPLLIRALSACPGGQATGGRALTVALGLPGPGRWVPSVQPGRLAILRGEQADGRAPSRFSTQPFPHSLSVSVSWPSDTVHCSCRCPLRTFRKGVSSKSSGCFSQEKGFASVNGQLAHLLILLHKFRPLRTLALPPFPGLTQSQFVFGNHRPRFLFSWCRELGRWT